MQKRKLDFGLKKYNDALSLWASSLIDNSISDEECEILYKKVQVAERITGSLIANITGLSREQAIARIDFIRDFGSSYHWFLWKYNIE